MATGTLAPSQSAEVISTFDYISNIVVHLKDRSHYSYAEKGTLTNVTYNGCNTSWENDNISSIGSSPGLGFIMGSPAPSPLLPQLSALLPQFLALPLELVAISLELMALMARRRATLSRPATPLPSLPEPYLNGAWESQQLFSVCHSRTSYQKTRN